MKRIYFIALFFLAALYFSCNDQDKPIASKIDISLLESKVEITKESTKKIDFCLNGENKTSFNPKEILLKVKNGNDTSVEIEAPKFSNPNGKKWNLKIQANEGTEKDGKIVLEGNQTRDLKYSIAAELSGDKESGEVEVFFAGKKHKITFSSYLVGEKLNFQVKEGYTRFTFFTNQDVNQRILFEVVNTHDQEEKTGLPEFDYPQNWRVSVEPDESTKKEFKKDQITLAPFQIKNLTYKLSGKAPTSAQSGFIKVRFARKNYEKAVQLESILHMDKMGASFKENTRELNSLKSPKKTEITKKIKVPPRNDQMRSDLIKAAKAREKSEGFD